MQRTARLLSFLLSAADRHGLTVLLGVARAHESTLIGNDASVVPGVVENVMLLIAADQQHTVFV